MKKLILSVFLLSGVTCFGQVKELQEAQDTRKEYIDVDELTERQFSKSLYVNPFIGTGGHGHTYPGASAPFGMMQLSPDTRHDGWDGCSGYHYSDSIIYGFSHTHLSGTGVPDYCDLLITPQLGKPRIEPGYEAENGYKHTFSHDKEVALPGFYQVELDEGDISARLTVSDRAGFHNYKFNQKKGKKFILIDLDHRDEVLSATINTHDKWTISGSRTSKSWATKQHFYFFLKLDTPYQKARIFNKNGKNKLLLIFPKRTKEVNLKVGISAVDSKGARQNLEKEIPGWNFKEVRATTTKKWNKELDKVYFWSDDKEVMTNFYTALYHSYLNPNVFSDIDGRYRSRNGDIEQLSDVNYKQYTVFSLWDTYRATHPLFTLTQQYRTKEFMETFLRQYEEGGDLPVWELAGNETECMIGYHSVSAISDAYTKGVFSRNADKLLDAMIATSNFDEFGKKQFSDNGFISTGDEPESVSKGLEYAYDDFCISQMAKALRNDRDIDSLEMIEGEYDKRAMHFINSYDPSTKFMRGRRSGQWFSPFDPAEVNFNYTEANSWQYSLYAPHAVGVLRDLLGGKDSLEMWLDRLFSTESNLPGRHQVDITGLIGQYAHGNEPSHHMAYLYNYTNSPHKTQDYVDSILYTMYSNAPDGLSGNEDCGQMSSWYVLSALGLYQIAPGNPYYELGRPILDEGVLHLENGNEFTIRTLSNHKNSKYIKAAYLNGKRLNETYIKHSDIMNGGQLTFVMGPKPFAFEDSLIHAPTITDIPLNFVPAPYFHEAERIFDDTMLIDLRTALHDEVIHYTTDGTEPIMSPTTKQYSSPFVIDTSMTIRAVASKNQFTSGEIENRFVKKNNNVSITLESEYANQYAADGDFTLIDGIQGNNEYRTGDWQGYWAQDFVATIEFKEPVNLKEVGLGCLSDMKSWIFLPSNVSFGVFYEGENVDGMTIIETDELKEQMYPHKKNYTRELDPSKKVVKITVRATNHGKCPDWHLGAGNDTWLFVDEIFFR